MAAQLLYLGNGPKFQSVAKLDDRFERLGLNLDRRWAYNGDFPESLSGYDGIFLSGSPHGAYEDIDFISREHKLISDAAGLGHNFGLLATLMVPLLIAAGGYMGYVLVGSVKSLISTGYGQALILKVVLVCGLLALAAANKLRFIPGLQKGDPKAAAHLVKSIHIEWLVILAVLGTTAVLTSNLTLAT